MISEWYPWYEYHGLIVMNPNQSLYLPVAAIFTRGLSRCVTPEYIHFAKKLLETTDSGDKMVKQEFLRRFDFDMSHWPHDFSATRPASFGNIFSEFTITRMIAFLLKSKGLSVQIIYQEMLKL